MNISLSPQEITLDQDNSLMLFFCGAIKNVQETSLANRYMLRKVMECVWAYVHIMSCLKHIIDKESSKIIKIHQDFSSNYNIIKVFIMIWIMLCAVKKKSEQSCNLHFLLLPSVFHILQIFVRIIVLSRFGGGEGKLFSVLFCQPYLIWNFNFFFK